MVVALSRSAPIALLWTASVLLACGGHGFVGTDAPDAFGSSFMGDGLQCGAIFCSGSQQCCLVPVDAEASASGPTHKCDQDCESVCMDSCPDAGDGMPAMGGMPGMPATPGMPGTTAGPNDAGAPNDAAPHP